MTKPFVKWAGGKTQLLSELKKHLPKCFNKYFEPFVGGGALFFSIRPEKALLSDSNGELVHTYQVIQKQPENLISLLSEYPIEEDFFYSLRSRNPLEMGEIERAARFIYLNKTCFNGLYRVNKRNQFNVPWGKYKNPKVCDSNNLRLVSKSLQGIDLVATYFENALVWCEEGDFVYMDPPYVPVNDTSFVSYSKKGFNIEDQERLAQEFENLTQRGVQVMESNSDTKWVRDRYQDFEIIAVQGRRSINRNGSGRGKVGELIIKNY